MTTLQHLQKHHLDFAAFRVAMEESHSGRFDQIFWSFFDKYAGTVRTSRVLDLGTGPGMFLCDLFKRFDRGQCVGLEVQPEMLTAAKQRIESLQSVSEASQKDALQVFEQDISEEWSLIKNQKFDIIVASMVLHEMPVPMRALRQVTHHLNSGGVLVLYDWLRQPLQQYCSNVAPENLGLVEHFSEHCRYTAEDYRWMCLEAGLHVKECLTRQSDKYILGAFSRNG